MPRRRCWFAENLEGIGPCDGRLVRCHLIPRQLLRRHFGGSASVLWDTRTVVWGCGGITGCSGHHGAFDTARTLRIPREKLPAGVEAFAKAHGLTWWLDRTYGPL